MREICLDLRKNFSQFVAYVNFADHEISFTLSSSYENPENEDLVKEFNLALDSLNYVTKTIPIASQIPRPKAQELVESFRQLAIKNGC